MSHSMTNAEYISRMCELSRQYAVLAWSHCSARCAHIDELAARANHVIAAMERNA